MPIALVTGATAGIGRAFAHRLARDGHDLILTARTPSHLDELATTLHTTTGVGVETLAADLSTPAGCQIVEDRITGLPPVDLLVNNAGSALNSPFPDNTSEAEQALLHLTVQAVLRLTHATLPTMIARRTGAIVNVSSVTALGPGWLASTYPAHKAWELAFSESLAHSQKIRQAGVRVMALLPGYTRTEFHQRAGIPPSHLPGWLWLDADDVVSAALRDLRRGRTVSVPSLRYKALAWGLRHLPRPWITQLAWEPAGHDCRQREDTSPLRGEP